MPVLERSFPCAHTSRPLLGLALCLAFAACGIVTIPQSDAGIGSSDGSNPNPPDAPASLPPDAPAPPPDALATCPDTLDLCSDECVDLASDPNHCGACSAECGEDQACTAGTCVTGTAFEIARATAVRNPDGAGLVVGGNAWPGWRFEVPAEVSSFRVAEVGYYGTYTTGSIFAALVALDGSADDPDSIDLSSDDVVAASAFTSLPVSTDADVVVPLSATLTPGWYAVVFGTDAFGAQGGSGTIRDGQSTVTGSQLAFSLIQSTGELVLQGVTPRLFIRGFAF